MRFRAIAVVAGALILTASYLGGFATTAAAAPSNPIAGYWSVDASGHVFSSGDARDLGDLTGVRLNAPIVGIAPTRSFGSGFWLAAADGGVFTFGDARFFGSAANLVRQPAEKK